MSLNILLLLVVVTTSAALYIKCGKQGGFANRDLNSKISFSEDKTGQSSYITQTGSQAGNFVHRDSSSKTTYKDEKVGQPSYSLTTGGKGGSYGHRDSSSKTTYRDEKVGQKTFSVKTGNQEQSFGGSSIKTNYREDQIGRQQQPSFTITTANIQSRPVYTQTSKQSLHSRDQMNANSLNRIQTNRNHYQVQGTNTEYNSQEGGVKTNRNYYQVQQAKDTNYYNQGVQDQTGTVSDLSNQNVANAQYQQTYGSMMQSHASKQNQEQLGTKQNTHFDLSSSVTEAQNRPVYEDMAQSFSSKQNVQQKTGTIGQSTHFDLSKTGSAQTYTDTTQLYRSRQNEQNMGTVDKTNYRSGNTDMTQSKQVEQQGQNTHFDLSSSAQNSKAFSDLTQSYGRKQSGSQEQSTYLDAANTQNRQTYQDGGKQSVQRMDPQEKKTHFDLAGRTTQSTIPLSIQTTQYGPLPSSQNYRYVNTAEGSEHSAMNSNQNSQYRATNSQYRIISDQNYLNKATNANQDYIIQNTNQNPQQQDLSYGQEVQQNLQNSISADFGRRNIDSALKSSNTKEGEEPLREILTQEKVIDDGCPQPDPPQSGTLDCTDEDKNILLDVTE